MGNKQSSSNGDKRRVGVNSNDDEDVNHKQRGHRKKSRKVKKETPNRHTQESTSTRLQSSMIIANLLGRHRTYYESNRDNRLKIGNVVLESTEEEPRRQDKKNRVTSGEVRNVSCQMTTGRSAKVVETREVGIQMNTRYVTSDDRQKIPTRNVRTQTRPQERAPSPPSPPPTPKPANPVKQSGIPMFPIRPRYRP